MNQPTQDTSLASSGTDLFPLAASIEALHQELFADNKLSTSPLYTYLMHKVRLELARALKQADAVGYWEQEIANNGGPKQAAIAMTPGPFLTVTTTQEGQAVAVTWQDEEHRILETVWSAATPPKSTDHAAAAARLFMQELLGAHSTLSAIVDKHGQRTVLELHHLQQAILNDSFVLRYEVACYAYDVASALPSGKRWAGYFRMVD